jgi:long-subunit fatty acid transport protein
VAWSQGLPINSSPNVVGSGARALGMGGAFIAVADDATAASWNPGGLTQLERPEISLVYSYKHLGEEFGSDSHPELDGEHSVDFQDFNYISGVYPIRRTIAGRNLVLSLNYQAKYDFDRDLDIDFRDISAIGFGNIFDFRTHVKYRQRGQLASLSPAFGFEITDRFSAGMVMNIWDHSLIANNEWEVRQEERRVFRVNGQLLPVSRVRLNIKEKYENFDGISYTFGALYRVSERLKFGAVYHTKFTADVDYTQRVETGQSNGLPGFAISRRPQQYTFPSAIGLGVSYQFPNDKLTLSMDVTRREWDQFVIHDPENRSLAMRKRSGITGLPVKLSPQDPTYTVRLGAEYVFVNANKPKQDYLPSLRAGAFYDPEPAGGRPDKWFGLGEATGKVENYYGVSLGAGLLIKNRVNIDAAYIYRWGDDVRKDTFSLTGTDADVDQHAFYLSTVIYF